MDFQSCGWGECREPVYCLRRGERIFSHSYWRRRRWRRRHDQEIYHFQGRQRRHRVGYLPMDEAASRGRMRRCWQHHRVDGDSGKRLSWCPQGLAVDILKFNLVVLSGLIQVFCLQTHASIGTLFDVGHHREIDHVIIHGLKVGVSTSVQSYLAGFGIQG